MREDEILPCTVAESCLLRVESTMSVNNTVDRIVSRFGMRSTPRKARIASTNGSVEPSASLPGRETIVASGMSEAMCSASSVFSRSSSNVMSRTGTRMAGSTSRMSRLVPDLAERPGDVRCRGMSAPAWRCDRPTLGSSHGLSPFRSR